MTSKENIKHPKTMTESLKELEMRIYEEKKNKTGTKYLIKVYIHDIKDIEREISELSDKNSEEGIKLSKIHHAYSIGLEKLKNNINKPVIIGRPPFTILERQSERMNELLSNG